MGSEMCMMDCLFTIAVSVDGDHADAAVVIDVRHLELRPVVAFFFAHQTPDAHALVGKRLLGYGGGRVEYIRIGVAILGGGARARGPLHRVPEGRARVYTHRTMSH